MSLLNVAKADLVQQINKTLMKKKIVIVLYWLVMIAYLPIWLVCWLLQRIARLLLAFAYLGLLDWHRSFGIIKSLFTHDTI